MAISWDSEGFNQFIIHVGNSENNQSSITCFGLLFFQVVNFQYGKRFQVLRMEICFLASNDEDL